jgi:hypothetical protein
MSEMIGLVGAAALPWVLRSGVHWYQTGILGGFLVCEIVMAVYVFFCHFVPLFNFVSRIRLLSLEERFEDFGKQPGCRYHFTVNRRSWY